MGDFHVLPLVDLDRAGGEGKDPGQSGSDGELRELLRRIRLVAFDFDGVFTDNAVWVTSDGTESVRCWRSDGIGLRRLEEVGVELVILSSEENAVVMARSRKLKIDCIHGCVDKLASLRQVCAERGVGLEDAAFVGNDVNDLACLRNVGLPIVVRDSHPEVVPAARYRTRTPGGYGAVREVCDLFYHARQRVREG